MQTIRLHLRTRVSEPGRPAGWYILWLAALGAVTGLPAAHATGGGIILAQLPPAGPVAPQSPAPPPGPLVWDATNKVVTVKAGATNASFVFAVSNSADYPSTISSIQTSCGCTVAKAPPMPWTLEPHTGGKVDVTVDFAGKSGLLIKQVTVNSTNGRTPLLIRIEIPESPEAIRARNQQMAQANPMAIFRSDCARCHADPAAGKLNKELYDAVCGVCHEAEHRATMVPDLHNLNHPTDQAFWRDLIKNGKSGTLMPPFSAIKGGPLSDVQIESLVPFLVKTFPSKPAPVPEIKPAAVKRP